MNQQQEGSLTPFEHYFKKDQIRLTAKVEIPPIQQQITYQVINVQDGHQVIQFCTREQFYLDQNEIKELQYWIDQNIKVFVSTLFQQLITIQAEQYQQPAQQNIPHLIIEILDVGTKQIFSGSLSEENITTKTNEQEDSESVLEFVKENIVAALNPASSFYIKLDKEIQNNAKEECSKERVFLQVHMVKQKVNEQLIESIKESQLQEKVNEKISQVRQQIEQLNQQVQTPNPIIQDHEQRIVILEQVLKNTQYQIVQLKQQVDTKHVKKISKQEEQISNLLERKIIIEDSGFGIKTPSLKFSITESQNLNQTIKTLNMTIQQQQEYIQVLSLQLQQAVSRGNQNTESYLKVLETYIKILEQQSEKIK